MADTTLEISWVCSLLNELQYSVNQVPIIYYDNIGATQLSSNPVFHSMMKHVSIDFHFIHERV